MILPVCQFVVWNRHASTIAVKNRGFLRGHSGTFENRVIELNPINSLDVQEPIKPY